MALCGMMACTLPSAHYCIGITEVTVKLCDMAGATRNTSDPLPFDVLVDGCARRNLSLFTSFS